MLSRDDSPSGQRLPIEVLDAARRPVVAHEPEHLIEVTIVDRAVMSDGERGPAHHPSRRLGIEELDQSPHVRLVEVPATQKPTESPDRHVRHREEPVEHDPVPVPQLPLVVGLEGCLGARQRRSTGVVYQVESEFAAFLSVSQLVQQKQRLDRSRIDPLRPAAR